jgi:transposase
LLFGVRLWVSVCLALYVAFWLELNNAVLDRHLGGNRRLIADKAYDTNAFRQLLAERGVLAIIPSSARRKPPIPHKPQIYRQRSRIERMFGRLNDFRRIATPYHKLATNDLARSSSPRPSHGGPN